MGDFGFVTLEVTGLQAKRRRFATWGQSITTLAPAWEKIADDLRDDVLEQFRNEGGVFRKSGRWMPLAPSTIKDRMRKGYPGDHPIMFRTGYLLASLMYPFADKHIEEVTETSLTFGTSVPWAKYHQFGGKTVHTGWRIAKGRKKANETLGMRGGENVFNSWSTERPPQRPILGISWERSSGIVQRLNEYIQQTVRDSGL